MNSTKRWKIAQAGEKRYWQEKSKNIENNSASAFKYCESSAKTLKNLLKKLGLGDYTNEQKKILEIGCGPVGIISYYPGVQKFGIDPLNSFYEKNYNLVEIRKSDVVYSEGIAEELQFGNNNFDLIIIKNCIDHVKDIDKAMDEIYRVLSKDGLLYLTVNCRTKIGYFMHRAISKCRIDKSHPHTFTINKTRNIIEAHSLKIIYMDTYSNYRNAFKADIKSKELQNILKAVSGVSEYLVRTVSIKEG
jgi:ubiquinone/menaquinone biosynthesis C-methylase UbiE